MLSFFINTEFLLRQFGLLHEYQKTKLVMDIIIKRFSVIFMMQFVKV